MPRKTIKSKPSPKQAHIPCAHPDCHAEGEYRAPKSRLHVEEEKPSDRHLYLCLEHVREYNQRWDYFSQMSIEEIERFLRDAIVGHRKTKPIGSRSPQNLFFSHPDAWFFGFDMSAPKTPASEPKFTKAQRAAMALLNIEYPFTEKDLKARYRTLVKKHHPDTNGGDKKAEALFKNITEAYRLLKEL